MKLLQIQDDRVKDLFNEYISITRYTEDKLSTSPKPQFHQVRKVCIIKVIQFNEKVY